MGQKDEMASRIGLVFQGLIDRAISGVMGVLPALIAKHLQSLGEAVVTMDLTAWEKTVNEWVARGYCDVDTGEVLKKLPKETNFVSSLTTLIIRIKMLLMLITSSMDIVGLDRQYDLMSKTTPNPAPADNLVRSMIIDPARATENRAQMKRLGYSDTQIDNIILSHYNVVPEGAIMVNYLRGNYTSDKMYERMRELGYTDTRTQEIVKTWQAYPGPQDLFTMVAHEAFEPDMYGPMGLADEFPVEQIPWLEAQGISKEWAMKYWISHWAQPSLEQGFEMLHRGVINRDQLDMLFRVVEIPKYWRDKLMAITYNPYTRVDARRMHELGVLSSAELVQSYQDLGYDAAKAVKMAEFTIKYNAEGDKQLTRSVILDSFRSDLISRADAMELLISGGYDNDVADFYLTHEEYKQAIDLQKLYIGVIEDRYKLGMSSETDTRSALNKQNLRGSKIDALMGQWTLAKYKYEDLPSRSELDSMLIQKIISEGNWRDVMTRRGFSYEHQGWYLKLIQRAVTVSRALPTKAEITSWYKRELITEVQYRGEMAQLGYSDYYIQMYLNAMG